MFEGVAGERVREANPALVEDDQVAGGGDRAEGFGEVFGEWQRRLARPPGEGDDRGMGFADRGAVAAQCKRQCSSHGACGVERDGHMSTGEDVAFPAGREGDLGLSRGGDDAG